MNGVVLTRDNDLIYAVSNSVGNYNQIYCCNRLNIGLFQTALFEFLFEFLFNLHAFILWVAFFVIDSYMGWGKCLNAVNAFLAETASILMGIVGSQCMGIDLMMDRQVNRQYGVGDARLYWYRVGGYG